MNKLRPVLAILGLFTHDVMGAQMRSRAEGVPDVQASNTVGLGDIWVTAGLSSYFRIQPVHADRLEALVDSSYRSDFRRLYGDGNKLRRDLLLVPEVGASVGIANFLQLDVQNIPWDGEKIGASTARLKFTTPNNDNLRVFGLGVSLNATLSTEEDIYSRGETTPGFDPILYFGVLADLDLIKAAPALPWKLYLNYASLDDYRLAHAYAQHQIRFALEYKGYRKGYYVRGAALLYKPLATRFNPDPGSRYLAPLFEFGIGLHWSWRERFRVAADLALDPIHPLTFIDKEFGKPPRLQLRLEAPLMYQETRAEAIRALIFNDQQRKKMRMLAAKNPAAKPVKRDSSAAGMVDGLKLDELSLEERKKSAQGGDIFKGVLDESEEEVLEKRKQIRSQLKQIEDLLE